MATGNSMMKLVTGAGWSRGLNNLLRGELKNWFSTRTWWVQVLIWAACINVIFLMVALSSRRTGGGEDNTMIFTIFLGLVGPIGVSIVMQSAVVGEKRSGTAAWVLSKPVSRPAFILSKLIGNTLGIAVTMLAAQGVIAYLIAALILGVMLPVLGFVASLGVHLVNILFYLTLTLMLGAIFDHPAPVIGIPMAFLFGQNFLSSLYPPLIKLLPYSLAIPQGNSQELSLAGALMTGTSLPSFLPLYFTLGASVLFIVIALWVFQRQEL